MMTDACNVVGGGMIYQWQELNRNEWTNCHHGTKMVLLNTTTPLTSGAWFSLVTRVGNGTIPVLSMVPMSNNSWWVCWYCVLNPDLWDLTLFSSSLTRNQ